MITEDYCSFEIAKLLKEKGFDAETEHELWYVVEKFSTGCHWNSCIYNVGDTTSEYDEKYCIAMPTLQMAMKWLREVHKLYVNVCPSVEGYYWTEKWHSYVENLEKRYPFGRFIGTFNSHEQACEAAIKYCLTNLI